MIKRILAAMAAFTILLSLCACAAEQPEETLPEQTTGAETRETTGTQENQEPFRWLSYEEYMELTPEQQQAYYKRFSSPEEYMVWFNAVAKAYNDSNNSTQIEGNEGHITQPIEPEATPVPETTVPTQQEEQITPETTAPVQTGKEMPALLTYEEYMALSPAVQQAYYESFPSMEAYMQWFNEAAKEYTQSDNSTQVEGNVGQVTQPTEPKDETAYATETTESPGNQAGGGLEGSASQGKVDF